MRFTNELPPRDRQFWAFLANPRRYNIEGAVGNLDEDAWLVPDADVRKGDRAVIWKARGNEAHRGIVAFADILSDPAIMEGPESSRPFWVQERPAATRRVRIRYVRPPGLPVWFEDHAPAELDVLTVSRGQGSGPYIVQPEQWAALLRLVGGWTDAPEAEEGTQRALTDAVDRELSQRRGQGRSANPEFNRAVEQRGMAVAREHFNGWSSIEDTSANRPYDLVATHNGQTRYVEVKGTTGGPEAVTVTYNEVQHARTHPEESVLIVVHGVKVENDAAGALIGTGGTKVVVAPWRPAPEDLTPIAYRYRLPVTDKSV